jgi:hypothetical protein
LLTAILSLCALLFTQSALAAYACPGVAKAVEVAQMADAGMPCAETMSQAMDDEQPSLCHAHCQSAQGTLDQSQPGTSVAFVFSVAVLTVRALTLPQQTGTVVQPTLLRRSAGPPLAVTNCCFRI